VHKVSQILSSAGFNLRKWISNKTAVLRDVPENNQILSKMNINGGVPTKILGLVWQTDQDALVYTIKDLLPLKVSKRQILLEITQIFDPLELLSPCIVLAKILLQKLWESKLSWDESLPSALHTIWISFREQINELNQLKIPRRVRSDDRARLELHGFSDASQEACIYVRSITNEKEI